VLPFGVIKNDYCICCIYVCVLKNDDDDDDDDCVNIGLFKVRRPDGIASYTINRKTWSKMIYMNAPFSTIPWRCGYTVTVLIPEVAPLSGYPAEYAYSCTC